MAPSTAASDAEARSHRVRLTVSLAVGAAAGALAWFAVGWFAAPAVLWTVAAGMWAVFTWRKVWPMDAVRTAEWATREDPSTRTTHLVLLIASLASFGAVALLLVGADEQQRIVGSLLGAASIAASWVMVHTIFTLRYAALYYTGVDGGIDFNSTRPPAYGDFAYLGFTIGMTYQVSDTDIGDTAIRRAALQHAIMSFVLGAVVISITINTVSSLAG